MSTLSPGTETMLSSKPMDHVEELRYVAAIDQCAWDYARALMRSSADRIEALLKDCSDETPAVHSGMRKVLAECDEYLSRSPAEAIHAGSILHQAIKNTLKAKSASPAVRNDWCVCEACLTKRRKAQAQEASSIDECLCATKSNGDMIETHLVCPVHGTLKATGEQS